VLRAAQNDVRDDNAFISAGLNDEQGAWVSSLTIGRGWAGYPGGGYATVPEAVGLTNRMQVGGLDGGQGVCGGRGRGRCCHGGPGAGRDTDPGCRLPCAAAPRRRARSHTPPHP
jgi:hypothetical protein